MARKTYSAEFRRDAVELYRVTESATITQIAGDLGITDATLSTWIRAAGVPVRGRHVGVPVDPGDELARLRAENEALRAREKLLTTEKDILRAAAIFRRRDELVSRFQFVADHRDTFEVKWLCETVEISRSSFYELAGRRAREGRAGRCRRRPRGPDRGGARAGQDLRGAAGRRRARRGHDHRRRRPGQPQAGRPGHARTWDRRAAVAPQVRTTVPDPAELAAAAVPDLLERDFSSKAPNTKYVGDITHLPFGDGHTTGNLYLATVIDCFSRRLVGWSIAAHTRTELVEDALKAAQRERGSLRGAVFHADHGAQYTARDFAVLCERFGVARSMGAVGSSADNALAESFNATLKRETLQGAARWVTADDARHAVFRWVTRYTHRRHSWCAQTSPTTYEDMHNTTTLQPAEPPR